MKLLRKRRIKKSLKDNKKIDENSDAVDIENLVNTVNYDNTTSAGATNLSRKEKSCCDSTSNCCNIDFPCCEFTNTETSIETLKAMELAYACCPSDNCSYKRAHNSGLSAP